MSTETVVVNPNILNGTSISRGEFLRRIAGIKAIRMGGPTIPGSKASMSLPVFTYAPAGWEDWEQLRGLHEIVSTGRFSVFEGRSIDRVFAVVLSKKAIDWLRNVEVATMELQIVNWLAAKYCFNGEYPSHLPLASGFADKVTSFREQHYPHNLTYPNIWEENYPNGPDDLEAHYRQIAANVTGGFPEFLQLRECKATPFDESWGIGPKLSFNYRYAYFRDDDWQRIIVKGEEDDLERLESDKETWEQCCFVFRQYPQSGEHIFNLQFTNGSPGFIYVFQADQTNHYKIGFTADAYPYSRLGSLQTGSSETLNPVGHFRAASKRTEKSVHRVLESRRIRNGNEWFCLSPSDIKNLLTETWRNSNGIY